MEINKNTIALMGLIIIAGSMAFNPNLNYTEQGTGLTLVIALIIIVLIVMKKNKKNSQAGRKKTLSS